MSFIRVPPVLREEAGGAREVEAAGKNVRELLEDLAKRIPALGIGDSLAGRLLLFDALACEFSEVTLRRDPNCPVCGENPTITEYIDYVEFCSGRPTHA